jgi:hypothetical protein
MFHFVKTETATLSEQLTFAARNAHFFEGVQLIRKTQGPFLLACQARILREH